MSRFIVHTDAAACSARRRQRDTTELVRPVLKFPRSKRTICTPELKNPTEKHLHPIRTRRFRHKELQIGRSSDNRRFCSPNYSAWRRSRTESLLSNARYSISSPPCAHFARALGAPRTAHFATPPLGGWRGLVFVLVSS